MYKTVSVEDTLAVQDLLGRYCWFFDENRAEEWAALYTPDGVFAGFGPDEVSGAAALAQIAGAITGGKTRHLYGNLYLEHTVDDNTLLARFYNQVSDWSQGGKLVMLALCTATLVRPHAAAPWKIRRNDCVLMT
jgi:hypothetical protein